ncbi:hypothetical protein ACLESO_24440, partial [Pyxidicoccus sp. 3LG]
MARARSTSCASVSGAGPAAAVSEVGVSVTVSWACCASFEGSSTGAGDTGRFPEGLEVGGSTVWGAIAGGPGGRFPAPVPVLGAGMLPVPVPGEGVDGAPVPGTGVEGVPVPVPRSPRA